MKRHAPDSPLIGYTHGMQVALLGFMVLRLFREPVRLGIDLRSCGARDSIGLLARSYEREAETQLAVGGWQLAVDKAQPKVVEPLLTNNPQLPTAN